MKKSGTLLILLLRVFIAILPSRVPSCYFTSHSISSSIALQRGPEEKSEFREEVFEGVGDSSEV